MGRINIKSIFNEFYSDKGSIELVIQKLKDAGASQMKCTRALIFELKMPLPEADEIVVNSKAWKEAKSSVEEFRDKMYDWGG